MNWVQRAQRTGIPRPTDVIRLEDGSARGDERNDMPISTPATAPARDRDAWRAFAFAQTGYGEQPQPV